MPQYKIFQIQRSHLGPLPEETRLTESDSISMVLKDELITERSADAFGVESPSFAWFQCADEITLILGAEETANDFEKFRNRMIQPCFWLDPILQDQGYRPLASTVMIAHQGMGGKMYHDPKGIHSPIFAAPQMPVLVGKPGDIEFDNLTVIWFSKIQDVLNKLKENFQGIKIVFHGGGNFRIHKFFEDWCRDAGIEIENKFQKNIFIWIASPNRQYYPIKLQQINHEAGNVGYVSFVDRGRAGEICVYRELDNYFSYKFFTNKGILSHFPKTKHGAPEGAWVGNIKVDREEDTEVGLAAGGINFLKQYFNVVTY